MTATMTVAEIMRYGDDAFEVRQAPRPVAAKGELLIRNHAAGVNNIDLMIRRGELAKAVPLPFIPGVEGAGIVQEVGSGICDFEVGQRVMWFGPLSAGGYGQFVCVDARYVAPIGEEITFSAAAATPVAYVTAHHMLFDYGRLEAGSWVLVRSAAGGVGVAALQLARNAGFRTIALTDKAKHHFVLANGASAAFDYKEASVFDQVMKLTGGRGVELCLNAVAGSTIAEDLMLLSPMGQLISFGHLAGPPTGSAADLLMTHFTKSVGIRVSDIYTYYTIDPAGLSATLAKMATDLRGGRIVPQVFDVQPLAAVAKAHASLETGAVRGKVVISTD
ncbi:NADPH2:quinone reductase [Pleomorphomonas diazotrophica]|uniref:quinone oxidoreductase family protein n=1 Tax=Pleomorphomonas diazotrophica TaxID=1166257 RepID=UPI0008E79DA2|nr:zinc-binding alcohol dehydrogenase family protein [Pleomorphomonas diazotrophica]SFN13986.1 NADPH2:quinone reductase [Pleomorphomonas diazotrophica]